MEKYTLTKEVKADLFAIKRKIEIEPNIAFYTKEDRAVMAAAYAELNNGKQPCWNCSGFLSKIRLSLNNYFKWYDHNEMEKVTIEDRELKPLKTYVVIDGDVEFINLGSVEDEGMKEIIEGFDPPIFLNDLTLSLLILRFKGLILLSLKR